MQKTVTIYWWCAHSMDCWQGLDSGQDRLIRALYGNSFSCAYASQFESASQSDACQRCVLAPDSFTTGIDRLQERTVDTDLNGVSISLHIFQIWILPMMSIYLPSYLNLSSRNCTWDDGIKGRISRARDELSEDESPSFGQQSKSRSGGCNGWRLCLSLSRLPCTLNNSKLSWCLMSQCHYSYMTVLNPDNQIWKSKSTISMSTKLKLYIILPFYQSSCTAHGQLPEIYSRLMISINGVCESC